MIYTLAFRPEVEEDAILGYLWYEEKSVGLGAEFLYQFYEYSKEISRNPLLFNKIHREFRRRFLKKFPYAIYFQIEENKVIIFGLFHCARNPKNIRQLLNYRFFF
jgi:hypothetical protein